MTPPLPPEDSTASDLTFASWFTTRLPADIEAQFAQLDRVEADRRAAIEAAKPPPPAPARWRVDPILGDFAGGGACWICYADSVHSGKRLPKFRACRQCLTYDRERAAGLGLKMMLPLMTWHTQPVLPGHQVPTDPVFRGWLERAWNTEDLLQAWRIDGVRLGIALLGEGESPSVDDWVDWMHPSPDRSRACWDAFMSVHHQRLHDVLSRIDRKIAR